MSAATTPFAVRTRDCVRCSEPSLLALTTNAVTCFLRACLRNPRPSDASMCSAAPRFSKLARTMDSWAGSASGAISESSQDGQPEQDTTRDEPHAGLPDPNGKRSARSMRRGQAFVAASPRSSTRRRSARPARGSAATPCGSSGLGSVTCLPGIGGPAPGVEPPPGRRAGERSGSSSSCSRRPSRRRRARGAHPYRTLPAAPAFLSVPPARAVLSVSRRRRSGRA